MTTYHVLQPLEHESAPDPRALKNGHAPGPIGLPDEPLSRAERSRINGAKSRGPVTDEGKARSSKNARKHGLTAKLFLVDPADEDDYNDFKKGIVRSLSPGNELEQLLVENIVKLSWNLRQADNIETDLLRDNLERGETLHDAFGYDSAKVMALSLYQTRLDRRLQKLFDQLRKLRKDAKDARQGSVSLEALGEMIFREKARRAELAQNEKTNPDFEPESPKNEPVQIASPDAVAAPEPQVGEARGAEPPDRSAVKPPRSHIGSVPIAPELHHSEEHRRRAKRRHSATPPPDAP